MLWSLDRVEWHQFMYKISPSYSQCIYHQTLEKLAQFKRNTTSSMNDELRVECNAHNEDYEMCSTFICKGWLYQGKG